jgi:signal transduction histidine kinase
LTLRTKLSLVLSALLVSSIGATGAILIYESAHHGRAELRAKHQLLAENRAFALRDNFEILENELERLARDPHIDPSDNDPLPESQLLTLSHEGSVLYNTAVLFLSDKGECLNAVPANSGYRDQAFGDRPWFIAAHNAPSQGPLFYPTDEPISGRTLKIVQPVTRGGKFAGALVGVINLGHDNLITPALSDNLPPKTAALLVDEQSRIIYPTDASRAAPESGWAEAIAQATRGPSGTLRASAQGEDSLFAFAPVGAGTHYAVVFRWPWSSLVTDVRHQAWALVGILMFGIVMAAGVGLMFAAYLTRPIKALADRADDIARGLYRGGGTDEIGTLVKAFEVRQSELVRAQEALAQAAQLAAMGKTSAAIAHELKNSMGGLGMAVDLILQDPSNQQRVARLRKQVISEITRLRDVTDGLLSFSRAPRIERTAEDLGEIVKKAVEVLADVIADRGAAVEIDVAEPLPVSCDGHKMQSVVMNLVKNAVEAGKKVRVRARAENGLAAVEIDDDGPGLTEDARKHLFEPFFTTKPNGTGLGLPTSQRFVEAHGGKIESGRGDLGGARFRVELPPGPLGEAQGGSPGPLAEGQGGPR